MALRPGDHAAGDGSLARSTGSSMLRGAVLVGLAIVLGVILLSQTTSGEPFDEADDDAAAGPTTTTTTEAAPANGDGEDESDDTTTTSAAVRQPPEVSVLVANATAGNVAGAAGRMTERLEGFGYVTLAPTNADAEREASVLYFRPGFEPEARALSGRLDPVPAVEAMPPEPPVADLGEANLLLLLGDDLASDG